MDSQRIKESIRKHEGLRLDPYQDSEGFWTIGYGHKLSGNTISVEIAEQLLEMDLNEALMDFWKLPHEARASLNEVRGEVLVEMIFNLGFRGVLGFKRMLAAIAKGDFDTAADEMLDSLWAKQVGQRAEALADIMRRGAREGS